MIKQYGFEREFFVKQRGQYVLAPSRLPKDECGYLAESRSDPHSNPVKAAYLLLAEERYMRGLAQELKVRLSLEPHADLTDELRREALRTHGKNPMPTGQGNIYGIDYPAGDNLPRAGLHVHFSNMTEIHQDGKKIAVVPGLLNIPKIVQTLDKIFEEEITDANRLPGFYEMKAHGFEYRSLPATIDVLAVADALQKVA